MREDRGKLSWMAYQVIEHEMAPYMMEFSVSLENIVLDTFNFVCVQITENTLAYSRKDITIISSLIYYHFGWFDRPL